jgi:hypothetical protein
MHSKMISDHIRNRSDKIKLAEKYNSKMHSSLKWEIIRAILKDLLLNIVRFFIYISGCVPWQVNKWNKNDRGALTEQSLFQNLIESQNVLHNKHC